MSFPLLPSNPWQLCKDLLSALQDSVSGSALKKQAPQVQKLLIQVAHELQNASPAQLPSTISTTAPSQAKTASTVAQSILSEKTKKPTAKTKVIEEKTTLAAIRTQIKKNQKKWEANNAKALKPGEKYSNQRIERNKAIMNELFELQSEYNRILKANKRAKR